ncbi:unnamed protein product [Cuscuta campestris]|uniref:Uncharacterized protein n=1 Tax=Cuscuta campestris TaxID=132261 RepID=A0A484LFG3_9ASTE|nr:unnamed protein product [Cuscuta campestris]
MAWSEPESAICKHHPTHKQPPGVCSCCLRERLAKISGAASSNSYCDYTSASSSCSSGRVSPRGHRRISSDVAEGRFSGSGGCEGGLRKSRSIAFAADRRPGGGEKRREGFWSKLIKSAGKRTKKVLLH